MFFMVCFLPFCGSGRSCPPPVLSLASLPRLSIRAFASACGPRQLDEAEQAADAIGRYVSRAVPKSFAGAPQPRTRYIDFHGRDDFDACPVALGNVHGRPPVLEGCVQPDGLEPALGLRAQQPVPLDI